MVSWLPAKHLRLSAVGPEPFPSPMSRRPELGRWFSSSSLLASVILVWIGPSSSMHGGLLLWLATATEVCTNRGSQEELGSESG